MLAHTVPGCDGDDCGGLASGDGGCPYWKWKEREQDDNVKWPYDTVKIVQVLQPKMADNVPLRGLPMGVERADTIVLPVNARIVKDMHFDDWAAPRSWERLVWYPTDTHPGADYAGSSMVRRALYLIINYKHWRGYLAASSSLQAMATFLESTSRNPFASITLVAPPVGVYEYLAEALRLLPSDGDSVNDDGDEDEDEEGDDASSDDYLRVYPEHKPVHRAPNPIHCLTLKEYADEIGSVAEAIESSTPPEGLGWRTFLVTPRLGEPLWPLPSAPSSLLSIDTQTPTWQLSGGINPSPAGPPLDSIAVATPAWIPHRTSSFHRPRLTRARSH